MITCDNFIVALASEIDAITNHFVFDGYHALASLLKAPLASMLVLYIVLTGYAMTRGLIEKPQNELFKFAIRAGLIYMTAMNWDFFASHVRDLFVVGSESVAATLMQSVHKNTSVGSVNQSLQQVLNETMMLGSDLLDAGSIRKLTPYFAGMMVYISGSVMVGLAFIEIVIAKLMLAVTLSTAPLFILFTLFDQTKSMFERWLGLLSGFSFVLVFVSSVVGLSTHLLHWITTGIVNGGSELTAAMWVPLFIVSCLCVLGIVQAAAMGKSIGGSLCTSGGAAMVGGFIGGSLGAWSRSKRLLSSPYRLAKNASQSAVKHIQQRLRGGGQ
jgi:type IV secretion system protein VirB6